MGKGPGPPSGACGRPPVCVPRRGAAELSLCVCLSLSPSLPRIYGLYFLESGAARMRPQLVCVVLLALASCSLCSGKLRRALRPEPPCGGQHHAAGRSRSLERDPTGRGALGLTRLCSAGAPGSHRAGSVQHHIFHHSRNLLPICKTFPSAASLPWCNCRVVIEERRCRLSH